MPLNIEVNADFLITSDPMNVIVNRSYLVDPKQSPNWAKMEAEGKSGDTREVWRKEKFFNTVEQAFAYIVDQTIRECDATSISELSAVITGIKRQIDEVLAR